MPEVEVSVIVPVRNAESTIRQCVSSVLCQNDAPHYEVIVVDNGSTDSTPDLLRDFGDRIKIVNETQRGSYCARNTGITNAAGAVLLFTDSDCVVSANWIRSMYDSLQKGNAKLVSGPVRGLDHSSAFLRYCSEFCHTQEKYARKLVAATANMGGKRDAIIEHGGFCDAMMSGGDFEFCSRIVKSRNDLAFEPKAVVQHAYSASLLSFMKRNAMLGRWNVLLSEKSGKRYWDMSFVHRRVLGQHGLLFLFYKIVHDASFITGVLYGYCRSWLPSYSASVVKAKQTQSVTTE
jgi:glycosyltransferase involved in cell wall biosynthesis